MSRRAGHEALRLAGAGPVGSEFQVNHYTTSYPLAPSVAVDADRDFVVVWSSYGSAGSDSSFASFQGQRYAGCSASDLDADGVGDLCDPCPSDPTDSCDPDRSGCGILGAAGGTLVTPDGSVTVEVPVGALGTDTNLCITDSGNGTGFELTTDLGTGRAFFAVTLAPEGQTFSSPITITFSWPDAPPPGDGTIDGTTIRKGGQTQSPKCCRSVPYRTFRRYFGMKITWYLHSHSLCCSFL